MKNILTTLFLVFTLSLFSGNVNAQIDSTSNEVPRVCYNTDIKVKSFEKEGKDSKESKPKLKDNCFELSPGSITMTDHKGKVTVFNVDSYEMQVINGSIAYLVSSVVDGKDYQLLVHGDMEFVAVHDVKKNITHWYFMNL